MSQSTIALAARCFEHQADWREILTDLQRTDLHCANIGSKATTVTIRDSVAQYREKRSERLASASGGLAGLSTHIPDLDLVTGGLCSPDLIIIGGTRDGGKSNSSGKTCFASDLAREVAFQLQQPALFFSLEMSTPQILERMVSAESAIPLGWIRSSKPLDDAANKSHEETLERIAFSKLQIDDVSNTMETICAKARAWRAFNPKGGAIFVDYLQLIHAKMRKEQTEENKLSEISGGLKRLAKELNCPVVVLIQVNKGGTARGSAAIENDADIFIVIEHMEDKTTVLRVDKCRNGNNRDTEGEQVRIPVYFDRPRVRFTTPQI